MATIYLIRHGQASFGKENYDQLSDLGHQQAARLGDVLSQRLPNFDAVHLGSMLRHKQTAENCLRGFEQSLESINAVFDANWNEYDFRDILTQLRPEFSTAKGTTDYIRSQADPKAAFEQSFNDAVDRWVSGNYDTDYIESWSTFSARIHQAFKATIANSEGNKNIAVFTSGGPISVVSQHLLGVAESKMMQMNWTLLNCGVTKIVTTGSRQFLSSLNEHTHFEGVDNKHFITYA